ncbi:MAG: GNAT family N-acetyltransferase [Kofleriaceae bacterium]|nr:GNAT family N-acetyltransferase [Kofleriaceae bacterium]
MHASPADGFSVRLATSKDRDRLLAVVSEHQPGVDTQQRYSWLYERNPHGHALTWVATAPDTGEIMGVASYFRKRLMLGTRTVEGALGGDCFVRPQFRRRGIGMALHRAGRDAMKQFGIEVMFGTPTPANMGPLRNCGGHDVSEVVRYTHPVTAFDALVRRMSPRASSALRLDEMTDLDPRIDHLWHRTRPELRIATIRDATFYTWRFLRAPMSRERPYVILDHGRPVAACALERVGAQVRVIDLLAPREAWSRALTAIVRASHGCAAVNLRIPRSIAASHKLWRHGFLARDAKPLNIVLPQDAPTDAPFLDERAWYYSWADST